MIESAVLNPLLLEAYGKKITWLEASARFELDEIIATFFDTRVRVANALEGLNDEQAAFASPVHSIWSISESITHLIYSQGFYVNKLLDISTSALPHVIEAARGFGEGAQRNIPADKLRRQFKYASEQITTAIEGTRHIYDPKKTEVNEFFGVCNYQTWMFLLLAHEVDHLRQIVAMRRVARTEKLA